MYRFARWTIWISLILLCLPLAAQDAPTNPLDEPLPKLNIAGQLGIGDAGGEKVTLTGSFTIEKGSRRGFLTITAQIEPEWHIYSITQPDGATQRTRLEPAKSADYKLLGPFQPDIAPKIKKYPYWKVPVEEHEGQVKWTAPIEIAAGVKPESLTIQVKASGQVCKDNCQDFGSDISAALAGYSESSASAGEYQPPSGDAQLALKGHLEPAAAAPGSKARLVITAIPNEGWHVYPYSPQDPNQVGVNKPTLIHLNPLTPGWTRSPVVESTTPKGGHHEEPVSWTIELSIPGDSPAGESVVSGAIGLQTCNPGRCLPPYAVRFRAALPVKAKAEEGRIPLEFIPVDSADKSATIKGYNDVAKLAAEHPAPTGKVNFATLLPMIGFGLLGGLILNLMPCVLPVIGLKVLSFIQQGGQSRGSIFALNVWFALGLLSVFVALATLAAFGSLIPQLGQNLSWGQQFTFTSFKVAMVVVVFAFALSFLGVWEVPIPGFAQSQASGKLQQQEGPAGAFFKGIFTTLLATPCSGPYLGLVFGYTLAQPPLATYLIFTSVGLGMAAPYLLIGAFPGLVRWLPKPGEWMETFKQVMGFVLLGTVVYLFATISADYFIPTLALVIGVWFACWLIGRVPIYEDTGKQLRQWAIGIAAAAVTGWLAFTYLGPVKHLYEWQPYTPEAIAKLQTEGKTVMVDFTADWCLTCQANFRLAINTHRVKEVVEKNQVVPLLADWTDKNDTIKQKLADLNSNSIPVLAIYPAGKPGEVIILRDALLERQVIRALEEAGPSQPAAAATAMVENPTGG
ncbi:MAG TPA: thioredoxin family protein [Pirellulaceae bacterium]|nr:thioredoxin family protein [Pirellulaceae bacterium]